MTSEAGSRCAPGSSTYPSRRDVIVAAAALPVLALPGGAATEPPAAFRFGDVIAKAREAAGQEHEPPRMELAGRFAGLDYDSYRAIRFREERRLLNDGAVFAMDLLPPGDIYRDRVRIALVDGEKVTPVPFDPTAFAFDPSVFGEGADPEPDEGAGLAYSGLRLRYPLNSPDLLDEFFVFQGASYMRGIARNMIYGLSARGLAVGTGDPMGEEFPVFTDFWVLRPDPDARSVTVLALLESPSCTGAFSFEIWPGESTIVDVQSRLFPRVEIDHIGIAPLNSMYYFGPERRGGIDDFRDAVHDSSGLQIITGTDERLWRPLSNPAQVRVSAFQDESPRGFGLIQRRRSFEFYQDAEARYDKRPSAWIEPLDDWGPGAVVLVEIPVTNEFNDNIVAFWRPAAPLAPSREGHPFSYRLHWSAAPPDARPLARVVATRSGTSIHDPSRRVVAVDFSVPDEMVADPVPKVSASAGEVSGIAVRRLPENRRLRVSFVFDPMDTADAELRLSLETDAGQMSETWLYRWTRR